MENHQQQKKKKINRYQVFSSLYVNRTGCWANYLETKTKKNCT